jgi:maleate cis-trans isomerase
LNILFKKLEMQARGAGVLSRSAHPQIEAIADIERLVGKPVVNSNQALWGCVSRLQAMLPPLEPMPRLGRLMQDLN